MKQKPAHKPRTKAQPKPKKAKEKRAMTPDEPFSEPAPAPVETVTPTPAPPLGPEDLKTEQEKGGNDPVSPSEESPGPVETMEKLGIGPRQPYPEGDPKGIVRPEDSAEVRDAIAAKTGGEAA